MWKLSKFLRSGISPRIFSNLVKNANVIMRVFSSDFTSSWRAFCIRSKVSDEFVSSIVSSSVTFVIKRAFVILPKSVWISL